MQIPAWLRLIGVIYCSTRGTGTPDVLDWGTVPPLFRTRVKNFLSTAVAIKLY